MDHGIPVAHVKQMRGFESREQPIPDHRLSRCAARFQCGLPADLQRSRFQGRLDQNAGVWFKKNGAH